MGQQQELRRAAAEAFIESLGYLQQTLKSNDTPLTPPSSSRVQWQSTSTSTEPPRSPVPFDLDSLEDAIADIEQFMNNP